MGDPSPAPLVLIVDDDEDFGALVRVWLEAAGFRVETYIDAEALLVALTRVLPDVICLDLGLPGMGGMEALPLVRRHHGTVPVVMLTGDDAVDTVVEAMRHGAYDFVAKPVEQTKLVATVTNAAERYRMTTRLAQLEREAAGSGLGTMVGRSSVMLELFRQLEKVAASDITVLIQGESGSGKELVARAIHDNSPRGEGPLVAVNCAAVPESLQESEFFGHEKGAFTGAVELKKGRFEQADGGTLFMDEIAELSPSLQAKLLRVLEERKFERLGGTELLGSDFRLVAATHRDLGSMVKAGEFREDLYFRIAVLEIDVPPLRERDGDLELLTNAFLRQLPDSPGTRAASARSRSDGVSV